MGLRRKCARRFSLPSVQQKHAAWDWVCQSSNGPCSITMVALTSTPAQAALPLALRYPRLRTATNLQANAARRRRPLFGSRQSVFLDYLSALALPFHKALAIMFA